MSAAVQSDPGRLLDPSTASSVTSQGQYVNGRGGSLARRRFQQGQLFLSGNIWYGRWREDFVEGGKIKRTRRQIALGTLKDYPTKRLARRALDEQISHVNKISYRPMPTARFHDFAAMWEERVLSQFGESTQVNYRTHLRKHLVPFFGAYPMKDVTPEMVQHFVSNSTVSPKTTANVCITLQSLWRTAKAWGYVNFEVMSGVVLPTAKRVQRFFLSESEIHRIVAAAPEPYKTFYGLLAETGLRVGELCGLAADDIDLARNILQVRQSAWRGRLGDPKTNESIRVVEISPRAAEHIREYLQTWHPNEQRLLFASRTGTPWDQNLLLKRKLRPFLEQLGIRLPKGNGFHAFRHGNATLMSSFGAPLKLRQQRLGHVDGSPVTESIYTHVVSEDGRRIAEKLGEAIWGGVLDAIGREKENGSGVEPPKPFVIN
jgi:integrase